jgi:hypothetical protein
MPSRRLSRFIVALALMATGCGQAAPQAAPQAVPTVPPASPAIRQETRGPAPAGVASPSPVSPERIEGVIQNISGTQVALDNGRSFTVPSSARVLRTVPITAADLQPGQYVAITARRQPDNTLLASIVNIFPESLGQVAPGQRPMPAGNLMTNATIDQVEGTSFTVSFTGGGARVQLAPDARIGRFVEASAADLRPGDTITAQVQNDEARSVTILPSGR